MPHKGRSNEEIVPSIRRGRKVAEVRRRLGDSEQTFIAGKCSSPGSARRQCRKPFIGDGVKEAPARRRRQW
jgi:hypothetical protein